jgi:hypothetical protein
MQSSQSSGIGPALWHGEHLPPFEEPSSEFSGCIEHIDGVGGWNKPASYGFSATQFSFRKHLRELP